MTDCTKHTLGPWTARTLSNDSDDGYVVESNQMLIAVTSEAKEEQANANLIAAAPDLLAAAKDAYACIVAEYSHKIAEINFPGLYEAIQKAEGE